MYNFTPKKHLNWRCGPRFPTPELQTLLAPVWKQGDSTGALEDGASPENESIEGMRLYHGYDGDETSLIALRFGPASDWYLGFIKSQNNNEHPTEDSNLGGVSVIAPCATPQCHGEAPPRDEKFKKFLWGILGPALMVKKLLMLKDDTTTTVHGRNTAPVDMVNIPLFSRFYTSQVVQDFFHQQYDCTICI